MELTHEQNTLLFGKNNTPNIVAVEPIRGKNNVMEIYQRIDGKVVKSYSNIEYFVYINNNDTVFNKLPNGVRYTELNGTLFYNIRIKSSDKQFIKWIENEADDAKTIMTNAQYYIQTGNTLFKNMTFDDVCTLTLDIETITKDGYEFPNSTRPEDKIVIISFLLNNDLKLAYVLNDDNLTPEVDYVTRFDTEKELLEATVKFIYDTDPDILITYNGFKFDFPYIQDRCNILGVRFLIGRDGSEPYSFTTNIKFAEKTEQYDNLLVHGRHCIDSYFLAKQYDVVARKLSSLSLKEVAKHFNVASYNREYINGEDIKLIWRGKHDKTRADLLRYAFDDVIETQAITEILVQSIFYSTQIFPLSFQDVFRYGSGTKIDNLLIRAYYNADWSLPKPTPKEETLTKANRTNDGGYSDTFVFGKTVGYIVYGDIASLYPTLAELLGITSPYDELGVYTQIMYLLKELRFREKALAIKYKNKNKKLFVIYNAKQNNYKIIINTGSYGYLDWDYATFPSYVGACDITNLGRLVIKEMKNWTDSQGGKTIRLDTDGTIFIMPDKYPTNKDGTASFLYDMETHINQWILDKL